MSNKYAVFGSSTSTSPTYIGTSLLGFRIDNIISPQMYFSVQCTSSYTSGYIVFDKVLVNVGNAWSKTVSKFKAPYTGNYFFSFATAVQGSNNGGVALHINSKPKAYVQINDGSGHNDTTIVRGAVMVSLSINDFASFKVLTTAYSTADGLTNAQGFYYSPVDGKATAVAWSVAHKNNGFSGPISVMAFDTVSVNMQNVWNTTTNKATIPVAGTYLIDLTIRMYGSASAGNGKDGRLISR